MDVYEAIQYELWSKKKGEEASSLTAFAIAQAFSDEAIELLPKINRRLKKIIQPLYTHIENLHDQLRFHTIDQTTFVFAQNANLILSGQEQNISLFKKNSDILKFARQKEVIKNNPTANPVTMDTIAHAKLRPILQMYSFERIRHTGGKYVAVCPFHGDNGPSFFIYNNNTFHCFGCQANGSAIDFYMKLYNVNFFDAVKALVGI